MRSNTLRTFSPLFVLLLVACQSGPSSRSPIERAQSMPYGSRDAAPPPPRKASGRPVWNQGEPWMQGFVGVSRLESVTLDQSGTAPVEIDDTELDDVPFVGGGAQWKLGGTNVDLGVEGLFALGWKSNVEAFYLGGGGAVVAVDVDTLLVDLSVGPFASVFLGDKTRVYVGAGPIVQFLNYDQEEDLSGLSESGSGFGVGAYARTGIEFRISPTSLLGFGVRYTDSEIDLDDGLGDFDVEGFQGFLTMTTML